MRNETAEATTGKDETALRRPIHYGIWVLAVGMFTIFGSIGLGRFAIGMIIPSMGAGLGLTNTQLGIIVSGTFIGYLASTAASGALSVRFGPRKVIAVSLSLISVGMLVASTASSFPVALACQLLIGAGSGGSNVPAMGLVARWYSSRLRGMASGLMTVGSGVGFALAGVLVPYLTGFYGDDGWRMSWCYLAAAVFTISLSAAFILRNDPIEMRLGLVGDRPGEKKRELPRSAVVGRDSIYRAKPLWRLGAIYFLFGYSYVVFTTFLAKYLIADVGFTQVAAGRLWFAIGVASIASGFLWGAASDRIGRRDALFLIYALQGACLLALAAVREPVVIIPAALLYALTLWGAPAVVAAICADYVGGALAPAALGMITIFFGAGQIVSPWISGYMVDMTRSFSASFSLSAVASIVGAALILRTVKAVAARA